MLWHEQNMCIFHIDMWINVTNILCILTLFTSCLTRVRCGTVTATSNWVVSIVVYTRYTSENPHYPLLKKQHTHAFHFLAFRARVNRCHGLHTCPNNTLEYGATATMGTPQLQSSNKTYVMTCGCHISNRENLFLPTIYACYIPLSSLNMSFCSLLNVLFIIFCFHFLLSIAWRLTLSLSWREELSLSIVYLPNWVIKLIIL